MSWSSDIRCLYCDGKLPLYRKITNGQFCSSAHRRAYWQEQERLGIERLHQTHDSLRAYRVPNPESILGPEAVLKEIPAPPSEPVALPEPQAAVSYEPDSTPETPLLALDIATHLEAAPEFEPPQPAGFIEFYTRPQPRWPVDVLVAPEPQALAPTGRVRLPLRRAKLAAGVAAAGAAAIPVSPRQYEGVREIEPIEASIVPCCDISHDSSPKGSALAPPRAPIDEAEVPRADKLMPLASLAIREPAPQASRRDPWPAAPFATAQRERLSLWTLETVARNGGSVPPVAGLRPLSIDIVPLVHGTWIDNLRAMGAEGESPRYELSTPALRPRLRLASGSRYHVSTRDTAAAVATIEPENLHPASSGIAIPERTAPAQSAPAAPSASVVQTPAQAGPVSMSATVKPNEPTVHPAPAAQSPNLPQPLKTEPMRPVSRLEPLDAKPVSDYVPPVEFQAPPQAVPPSGSMRDLVSPSSDPAALVAWHHIAGFWKHAPRDLKLLVFGIPVLLALALHPSIKKIPYAAPQQASGVEKNIERNFQARFNDQWKVFRQAMAERAAVALDEDFRTGLDDWASRGGTTEWAFDATGFVRPGPLAIYRPSVELTDYQAQFLGMIDKKALSWVVRAADFDDYYVVKLVVLKPGPLPTVGVTRYAVIHGVAQDRHDTPAFINAREDMLYRVRMDVHGDEFALTVQGQLIDSWSEPRLKKGGIGFFTGRGEASRLRWVQVTHQYDMLGRLCAYLAPLNIPSTNGSWEP